MLHAHPRLRAVVVDVVLVGVCFLDGFTNQTPGWNRPFLLSVLALLAVAGRRLHPAAAFLLGAPALGWAQSDLAPAVLAFTLGARERREGRVPVLLLVGLVIAAVPVLDLGPGMWRADASAVLQQVALLGGAAALGALVRARRALQARVVELQQARARENALADAAARTQERTLIAREMHDVVSHQVSLIAIAAGALRVGGHPAPVTEAAESIRRLAVRTTDELRLMLVSLRAPADAPTTEGVPGLGDLHRLWTRAELPGSCTVDEHLAADVPASVQHQLYRVVQESLTNVHRHAPGSTVDLSVGVGVVPGGWSGDEVGHLVLRVRNSAGTGPGQDPTRGAGHGVLGMRERVELVGGRFSAGPTDDGGFEVVAHVPHPARRAATW